MENQERQVQRVVQVQLENEDPLVNEEHLAFKVYQVLLEGLVKLGNRDYLDLRVLQDLLVNQENLENEVQLANPAQEDRVVYRASEEPLVQKGKLESLAKMETKGLMDQLDRLDKWVFLEKGVVMEALDLKEMQVHLEAEVKLELLEKRVNPVDVGRPEKMVHKALLQPKENKVNQGQEDNQDQLDLLVTEVFLDSKDHLVYLVSLDQRAHLAGKERKVFLDKGALTVQLEHKEKEDLPDLLAKMDQKENLDLVVLLEHLVKQVLQVYQDLPVDQVYRDLLDHLVLPVQQASKVQGVGEENQGQMEDLEKMADQVNQDAMEREVTEEMTDLRDHQVLLAHQDQWESGDLMVIQDYEVKLEHLDQQEGGENLGLPVQMVKRGKEVNLELLVIQDTQVTRVTQDLRARQVKMVSLVRLDTLGNEVHLDQEELLDNLEHLACRVTVDPLGQMDLQVKEEIEENPVDLVDLVQWDL